MLKQVVHIVTVMLSKGVGIATGWTAWVLFLAGARLFSSPDRLWGLPSLLSSGYLVAISSEVERPGREADQSPPSGGEVKNGGSYTSTPSYVFMAYCLIN
jgi:hypothetical protein